MKKPSLSINVEGFPVNKGKIILDGVDISDNCRAVTLNLRIGEPATATFEVFIDEANIDAAEVFAQIGKKEIVAVTETLSRERRRHQ